MLNRKTVITALLYFVTGFFAAVLLLGIIKRLGGFHLH
jgi:hypothetical protein